MRLSAVDVALGISPACRVSEGGHHKPPARSMGRCSRNARKPVAFRNNPVAPTVTKVTPLRLPLLALPLILLVPSKVLTIPNVVAAIDA